MIVNKTVLAVSFAALSTVPLAAENLTTDEAAAAREARCELRTAPGYPPLSVEAFCPVRQLVPEGVTLRDRSGTYTEPSTTNLVVLSSIGNGRYSIAETFDGQQWQAAMIPWQIDPTVDVLETEPKAVGLYAVFEPQNRQAVSFWTVREDGSFHNVTEGIILKP